MGVVTEARDQTSFKIEVKPRATKSARLTVGTAHKLQTFNNCLTIARPCCPNIFWRGRTSGKSESLIQSVIG